MVEIKRLASPFGVAARSLNQWMPRAAQQIRGIQTYRRLHLPLAYASSLLIVHLFKLSQEKVSN
jgi:hypothetical protein